MHTDNLYQGIPENLPEELVDVLALSGNVRIERIVSRGHTSPPGYWYDQTQSEMVVLLEGSAEILFDGESEPRVLHKGDYLVIPPHARHRVEWTDPERDTVWLAVHY